MLNTNLTMQKLTTLKGHKLLILDNCTFMLGVARPHSPLSYAWHWAKAFIFLLLVLMHASPQAGCQWCCSTNGKKGL